MSNGGEINIAQEKKGNECSVSINCKGEIVNKETIFKDTSSTEELVCLKSIMENLNGAFEFDGSNNAIILIIPDR